MSRPRVTIPSAWDLDWQALPTADGNVSGPVFKMLSQDPDSGGSTMMIHIPPGWHDDQLDWHPCVEEAYILHGEVLLGGRSYVPGIYLYRPAGILHGPVSAPGMEGATIVHHFDKTLRILRYAGDEFPHRDGQPITDDLANSPVPWEEHLDVETRPWLDVAAGGLAGARVRELVRNRETGGGVFLVQLPAGWTGAGPACSGTVEEFVIDGSFTAGGERFGRWGYACRPRDAAAADGYASPDGALLICWWERDELAGGDAGG